MRELALIEWVRREAAGVRGPALVQGIGDDCAIFRPKPGTEIVVTTDFTLEGRHFDQAWHSPESVGHRCLARGLSDVAAMGARPMAAFLSLALPAGTKDAWTRRFFAGLLRLAERFGVPLAGGDTAQASGQFVLADIVLLGSLPRSTALRRSGARVGDALYVTGALGGAAAELERMRAGKSKRVRSGNGEEHPQLFPEPRIAVGQRLRARSWATACMDLSDGLATDLAHLCRESNVDAEIDQASLPVHSRATIEQALHGGEDYELLFTASPEIRLPKRIAGVPLTRIGVVTAAATGVVLVNASGKRKRLKAAGWEHFRS